MSITLPADCHADTADRERSAFNAAFDELGLRWRWDSDTYEALAADPCERTRLRRYLEDEQAHLLRAYDAEFLCSAILAAKQRCLALIERCPPHALPRFDWTDARWGEVGI